MDYADNSRVSSSFSEPLEGNWIPTWKKVDNHEFRERACHSSFIIGNSLLSFGGWNGAAYFNDVVAMNLTTMKPQDVIITGDKMISRYTHSANVFQGDKVIVVGGFSGRSGVIDEVAVLSVVSKKPLTLVWNILDDDNEREKLYRSDHSANIYGNYLYLFGGADKKEQSTDELWLLNLTKSQVHQKQYQWTKLTPSGLLPKDRYGHSSAIYNETLYIFGGTSTKSKQLLNDLWMINLRELKWQQISANDAPSPRTATTTQEVDGKLIIFGGTSTFSSNELFSFDLKTQIWKRIETAGDLPQGRAFHSCTYRHNKLIIWGGEIAHNKCTNTIFTLDLKGPNQLSILNGLDNQALREKKALNMIERIAQDDIFTDVVFEVEGQEIMAHRVVLAKACQHFYDLFTQGVVKQQTTTIKVPDAKAVTFKTFLKYIYCGEIELQYSLAIDLLGLTNEYSYDELKELCESYLSKVLTKENVLELSNVAEGFEAENLKNNILKFNQNNP